MHIKKSWWGAVLFSLVIAGGLSTPTLAADSWPDRPIKLVVPYPPGGGTDATARVVADYLGRELGQPIAIFNQPGAGGNIGANAVAKSRADGYTFLMGISTHVANMALYKDLPYDFSADLDPVGRVAFVPNALVVRSDIPVKDLKEFISYVKSDKTQVNYGTAGNGSSQHMAAALFNNMIDGNMLHIPYKGGAPAVVDLLAGRVDSYFGSMVEVLPHIQTGKIRVLGVTTRERSPLLPNVPAIQEELPGYEVAQWNGIMAPAGTDKPILEKMNAALQRVLAQPELQRIIADQGSEPAGGSADDFQQFIEAEVPKWAHLVKVSEAKID